MKAACLALLLAVVPVASPRASNPAEHPDVASKLRLLELWVEDQRAYQRQPGVVIGIVHDQRLIWARGFGHRDVARQLPARPDTIFRIASITKTFTATAIMQLRDAGRLQLDDPVAKHLPWFKYRNLHPDGPVITIRHLLTHTSGLPREAAFPYWTTREFPTREQMIEALETQPSIFEAETRYKYSNLGLALAGEVVAAVAGEPYADYVERRILEPLAMASTHVRFADVDLERFATGYLIRRPDGSQQEAPPTLAKGLTPAANISSTVEDLARFVSSQFHAGPVGEGHVLRGSTLREMHRVHWLSPSWQSGRGLGFSVWRQGERTLVGHGGWVAGYRTQIAFDPEAKLGVIVLTNCDEAGPGSYVRQAFDVVVPAIEKVTEPRPETASATDPQRYVGAYHSPFGERTDALVLDGRLVLVDHSYPPARDLLGQVTELSLEAEHTFRMSGDGNGELVIFELGPDGTVERVKLGENYLFPEGCGRVDENLRCTGK